MNVLGIIPARGGSKGVPGKNIKPILGKPLIHYTIERALESEVITHLYLSTDSDEIISKCSFNDLLIDKRPANLSGDNSPITSTIDRVVRKAESEHSLEFDIIILLQPTSPIRLRGEIDEAVRRLDQSECHSLISVCGMQDVHPARMYKIADHMLKPLIPELESKRRQDLETVYFRDGSFYLIKRDVFMNTMDIMSPPVLPFVRDSKLLLNIDEPRDIIIAEALLGAHIEGNLF